MENDKTKYIILPGNLSTKIQSKEVRILLDKAFFLWKEIWDNTFEQNGVDKKVIPDDFFKQKFIPIILHNDEIVAIHLYSIYDFNLKALRGHSYLKDSFNDDFYHLMEKENIQLAMSMESLAINPKFRKSKIGQSYFLAISYLGMRLFYNETSCDAIFCPVRKDVGIDKAAYQAGFIAARKNFTIYNTPVDIVYFKRNSEIIYPNDFVQKQVEQLWNDRINYADNHNISNNVLKAA